MCAARPPLHPGRAQWPAAQIDRVGRQAAERGGVQPGFVRRRAGDDLPVGRGAAH